MLLSYYSSLLGASSYTFAEATPGQDLRSWIGSHVRAFEFFGGVVEVVVPDNLKSAVTHPSYHEPDLNPTYRDLVKRAASSCGLLNFAAPAAACCRGFVRRETEQTYFSFSPILKKSSPHVFKQFDASSAMHPVPPLLL